MLILLIGCGTTTGLPTAAAPALPDRYSLPKIEAQKPGPQEGSIYSAQSNLDLYRDSRARAVGDIVLIKIVENSSGTKKASTNTARDSSITGGVEALFGVEQWLANRNANFTPSSSSLKAGLKNEFDGSGETKRDSNVTATLSARVVDTTMDGNLVIRGYREVRVNNETQFIILSGIVRPKDISQDNSILSSYIADARIDYSGTGVVSDKQQAGWLARGLDIIWPF
jgi:flagellar L-ring protein precursor FlgH